MKIHHILDDISIIVTNEERKFIKKFNHSVVLASLSEHDTWTAQNLVRKGVYRLTDDNRSIILNGHPTKYSTL
jgi:hypothetical protein